MQANGQNLILSLDCNSSEIRDGQIIKLVVRIKKPQKNNLYLDMSAFRILCRTCIFINMKMKK